MTADREPTEASKAGRIRLLVAGIILTIWLLLSGGFFFRILAIYVLPNFYMHARLKRLFMPSKRGKIFSFAYTILALVFPLAMMLPRSAGLSVPWWITSAGYYFLPFLLYLFLLLLLLDLLLLLQRLLRGARPGKPPTTRTRLAGLSILVVLALAIVAYGRWNADHVRVRAYSVDLPKGSTRIAKLRIALAADFHLNERTRPSFLENCISRINDLKPDIVLLPGDILEGFGWSGKAATFSRFFKRLRSRYGVFGCPGNHDGRGRSGIEAFFADAGIEMLRDRRILIDQAFWLVGRSDSHHGLSRKPLEILLEDADTSLPIILMDHSPIGLADVGRTEVDIQVSAHSHHGQLFPVNIITSLQYELSWGYRKIGNTHFFVTCGAQLWGPHVRTAGVSEIMQIDVIFR